MTSLKDKTILFLCVQTFDIEKQIIRKLEHLGAQVLYYDERPKNNFVSKALIRINKDLIKERINTYYNKILSQIEFQNINYLFVIRGEVVPLWFLKKFKKLYPKATLIYYTWDSFVNNPNALSTLKEYDSKLSFDPADCKKYKLEFRPLFYPYSFQSNEIETGKSFKFKLAFLGTLHSDRYRLFKKITSNLPTSANVFSYFYIQNILVYFFRVYIERSTDSVPFRLIRFKSLTTEKIQEIYMQSEYILDVNHPDQTGLTLRTFEAIGLNRKLITTNQNIKKYKFYDPKSVIVIDRRDFSTPLLNFENNKKTFSISEEFKYSISLDGWLRSIFEICEPIDFWISN